MLLAATSGGVTSARLRAAEDTSEDGEEEVRAPVIGVHARRRDPAVALAAATDDADREPSRNNFDGPDAAARRSQSNLWCLRHPAGAS